MKLHLIRHAKTELKKNGSTDFERKLLPKGIVQSNVMALYLNNSEIHIDFTFCSDAVRTKETMQIIMHTVNLGKISYHHELYLCDRETYLSKIWELSHGKDLLIFGHNEGISEFASYLIDDYTELRTCEYICIQFPMNKWSEVSRGTGTVTDRFRPSVCLLDWSE